MKKILALIVLFTIANFFLARTPAQAASSKEVEEFLQKSTGTNSETEETFDSQKDYVSQRNKELCIQAVANDKNNPANLVIEPKKENILFNDYIFAVYNAKMDDQKAYIVWVFIRDKENRHRFNLSPRFWKYRKENDIKNIETNLFGNNPSARQKFLEELSQKISKSPSLPSPTPTTTLIKSSP